MAFRSMHAARRQLGTISYTKGNRETLDLETGAVLFNLFLRLKFTITAGATAMIGPKWFTLARLIKKLEIEVQEQDNIVSMDGAGVLMRALRDYGTLPLGAGDTFALSGTTSYDIWIPLALFLPRSNLQTALDLRGINSATLAVTWGGLSDLVTTPGATAALSGVSLQVVGEYWQDVPNELPRFAVRELTQQTNPLTGSNSEFNIAMDKNTGVRYRSLVLASLQNDIAVDTVLAGNAQLLSGSDVFWNAPALMARASDKIYRSLESEANLTGLYPFEVSSFGQSEQMIPTNALDADLRFELDATYTAGNTKVVNYKEAVRAMKLGA
ncbi:MAG: hypothetical protein JKY94_01960 [Rhodobacteraceae bacterium]|nr:hypothetical protein [Paracoccaceae bacterium]